MARRPLLRSGARLPLHHGRLVWSQLSKIVPAHVPEIRISKFEIRNKSQFPISNDRNVLNFWHWNLFRISCLGFRI